MRPISSKGFFLCFVCLTVASSVNVKVYHYLSLNMGRPVSGFMDCGQFIICESYSLVNMGLLKQHFIEHQKKFKLSKNYANMMTVSV
jgi:hypothetical protein